jgi:transposase-like protein
MQENNIPTSRDAPWRDEKTLRELYVGEEMSAAEVGDALGCSAGAARYWVRKHGLRQEAHPWRDEELMHELYVNKELPACVIAERLGCTTTTVYRWARRHGFEDRRFIPSIEVPLEVKQESTLRELYCEERLTQKEIADRLGCSRPIVVEWMQKHGIDTRHTSDYEHHKTLADPSHPLHGVTGPEHPRYIDGESVDYGEGWNESKRRAVRRRDGFECRDCGMHQENHLEQWGMKLHVHHITPAKKVDDPSERNALSNLIALCVSCHGERER